MFVIPSMMLITVAQSPEPSTSNSRTGNIGNQPAESYYEGNDIFKIFHSEGTYDTSFSIGDSVYVRLTSPRVEDLAAKKVLEVRTYDDNKVIDLDPAFIQTSFS